MVELVPTPKDTILKEGTARLYRFRRPSDRPATDRAPLLVIPSLINRWYILDLRKGYSFIEALSEDFDTYLLDWGIPEDEDRYLTWDRVLKKIGRAVRKVQRETGHKQIAMMGYCMGATLSGIYAALHPHQFTAFINLAGPFDFTEGGLLRHLVDERWFDPEAITDAGNVGPQQMQSGFQALRPTLNVAKWVNYAYRAHDPAARDSFKALDTWSSDNTPFPAAAYKTYITDLYQNNRLVKGEHYALGKRVELKSITCPVLSIVASRDNICPPSAACGLNDNVSSKDKEVLSVRGGHVGAVVGSKAATDLYPKVVQWLKEYNKTIPSAPLLGKAKAAQA